MSASRSHSNRTKYTYRDHLRNIYTHVNDNDRQYSSRSTAPSAASATSIFTSFCSFRVRNSPHIAILALIGAGIGAGIAWMSNGSVTRSSLEGAGVAALGGLLMQSFETPTIANNQPPLQLPPPLSHPLREPPSMINERFGMMRDEELAIQEYVHNYMHLIQIMVELAGITSQPRGVNVNAINQLPCHVHSGGGDETCSVCLSAFENGQRIRTLPCMHQYHVDCIDVWLGQSRQCPVCKSNVA
jgi:hypothetical protein